MELLGKIFGNPARVKIMRLFLFNSGTTFSIEDISTRCQITKDTARKEMTKLSKISFVHKKEFIEKVALTSDKKSSKKKFKKIKKKGFILNKKFELIVPLEKLLIDTELINNTQMLSRLKKTGKIQLLILSGMFLRDENRKLDLLIVGDKIKTPLLVKEITKLESEIGREIAYADFDVEEFQYRLSMYDKLLRDVLDNNHTTLINKILV